MCECLEYDDGSMHLCEVCAEMWKEHMAAMEKIKEGGIHLFFSAESDCWIAMNYESNISAMGKDPIEALTEHRKAFDLVMQDPALFERHFYEDPKTE